MDLPVTCKARKHLEEYIGEYRVRNTEEFHKQDTESAPCKRKDG